jgi:zinc/manganese transport system ATP-binding protein
MNPVRVRGATLGFVGRPVLHDIDFSLAQGEFVGLLGPNGAGKTTLLRSVLGLLPPLKGSVEVLGAPARHGRADIGYLPQTGNAAPPALCVRDVLAASFDGHRNGLPSFGGGARRAVETALAQAGALALAPRRLNTLSGGERQRVLIAQALMGAPRLLLLDEPLAGLDPRYQNDIVTLLRRVQQELAITVLCTAHDINVLLPAMDRALFVGNGAIAIGPVAEVATAPVLSRLYGAPMDVVRAGGHVFVAAATIR